jgi:hypothetical protein
MKELTAEIMRAIELLGTAFAPAIRKALGHGPAVKAEALAAS